MYEEAITPITYVVCIIAVVFFAVAGLCIKMDSNAQTYCNDAIVEFVDKSRASGYISAEAYIEMMTRINDTNNLYNVSIMHQSKTLVPFTDENGNALGGVTSAYNAYYKDDILDYIFSDDGMDGYHNYALKNGDYLKVSFELSEPTFATKLVTMFSTHTPKTIYGAYGGYVGSTEEYGTAY